MQNFDDSSLEEANNFEHRRYSSPPLDPGWRIGAGVPLFTFSVICFLALISYDWQGVPALFSPAKTGSMNWMGRAGAELSLELLSLFGIASYVIPILIGYISILLFVGKAPRWKPLWCVSFAVFLAAMAQFLNSPLAPLLSAEHLNIAPNAGGGIGSLLNLPGQGMRLWLGDAAVAVLYAILTLVSLVLLIGIDSIKKQVSKSIAKRKAERKIAEEAAFANPSELEEDRLSETRAAKARAEANQSKADEEAVLRAAEADAAKAEKTRLKEEQATQKAKLREERAAQKARLKEEREAEKARIKQEKEAKKKAKNNADGLFTEPVEIEEAAPALVEESINLVSDPAPASIAQAPASYSATQQSPIAAPVIPQPAIEPAPAAQSETPKKFQVVSSDLTDDYVEDEPPATKFRLPETFIMEPLPQETVQNNEAEIAERSRIIVDTLGQFGFQATIDNVVCGPVITRYEVKPAAGVRVDKLSSYRANLQMSLKAKSIRLLTPIPGKDVAGIEVPNINRRAVPLRGIAESREWAEAKKKMAIPMLLGKDIDGNPIIADLAKMPHIIVAGSTGSGKSVCLNSILAGIMLSRTPAELRIVLVDPKRVEFTPYAHLPHLVVPVITEAPKVAVCLQWAIDEMNRRLKLFETVGVRNIASYNNQPKQGLLFPTDDGSEVDVPEKLPYIVIVIDEMADLMMNAGSDVEPRVDKLGALARAVGIHMILATQRPDVKVITGKIKNNFPARIAFKVVGQVNSITILDCGGAETLIGNGDMLFMNPSAQGLVRAQGCWINDDDIRVLNEWYRKQGKPHFIREIKDKLDRIKIKDISSSPIKGIEDDDMDSDNAGANSSEADPERELLAKCLQVIVELNRASTSQLQRKLRLGYNKAARIMDQLYDLGCIGPPNGASPREILRTTLPSPDEVSTPPEDILDEDLL